MNCPDSDGPDFDFAYSDILVSLPNAKRALLLGQKSAVIYAVDPDRRGRAVRPMRLYRERARLAHREADLVEERFLHTAAPRDRGGDQPCRAHMHGQRRKAHLNSGHRCSQRRAATSPTSWP